MKIKTRATLLVLLSGFFYSSITVAASGSAFGVVGELVAGGPATGAPAQDLMYFKIVGSVTRADCVAPGREHFVIKNDDGGKTMVALLLAAKLSEKKVHVAGRGTCTYMTGFEDVSYIYID